MGIDVGVEATVDGGDGGDADGVVLMEPDFRRDSESRY